MSFRSVDFVGAASAVLVFSLAAGLAGHAYGQAAGGTLTATMSGAAEKPKAADPDGTGTASFKVDPAKSQVCYDLQVSGIGPATMAHIHKAPTTAAGPVVIPLKAPGADGKSAACATADPAVVKDILKNPGAYYVNVHDAEFPAGAIRGQLTK